MLITHKASTTLKYLQNVSLFQSYFQNYPDKDLKRTYQDTDNYATFHSSYKNDQNLKRNTSDNF